MKNISVNTIFLSDGVSSREKEINLNKKLRQESAKKAGLILGTAAPIFCDYPDNLFDTIPLLRIVKTIEEVVKEIKPEIVYTHHYGDLNIDHQITHRAVMTACRPLPGASVKNIISFEEELKDIKANDPTIVGFGNDSYDILQTNLGSKYNIIKAMHYSHYISKENYRKHMIGVINDWNNNKHKT